MQGVNPVITLVEARNFRCLRYISQPLSRFHVLVGPNASGKTTFLDVIGFLGKLVSDGLEAALTDRTHDFRDLIWGRPENGGQFELAFEARIPDEIRAKLSQAAKRYDTVRYAVRIGLVEESRAPGILEESVRLKEATAASTPRQRTLFPETHVPPSESLLIRRGKGRAIMTKKGRDDHFYSEANPKPGKGWIPSFTLGPYKSALANFPADESRFPVAVWLNHFLTEDIQRFVLNSLLIRQSSPPSHIRGFRMDGSNLPWVVAALRENSPERHSSWIAHLATVLPDLKDVEVLHREDDKSAYLCLRYPGVSVPSWVASDGTLRLLALTLPAYLVDQTAIYLIEEPENGIHPRAVEAVVQSLSSVYRGQVLLATHSPAILASVELANVLCFAKTKDGATDIVSGDQHPKLRKWRGETDLGTLFAAGVLG